jgi:hypothetical protein
MEFGIVNHYGWDLSNKKARHAGLLCIELATKFSLS